MSKLLLFSSVAPGGRLERQNVTGHEMGNIVLEIWADLPQVYTFGAESEIHEIFSKKL